MKDNSKLKLTFYGGVGSVTGANFLLDTGSEKILVDCGMMQGGKFAEDKNKEPFAYDPSSMDFLLVTHAHIDHIGRIPKLVRDGFRGQIISTPPTLDIAREMFEDAYRIMLYENPGAKEEDLVYRKEDIAQALSLWKVSNYHEEIKLGSAKAEFYNAGHILGSTSVKVEANGITVGFTGDLGNSPSPLLPDLEPMPGIDYLVTESVYGDRVHENVEDRENILKNILNKAAERGGAIVMPVFSVERTQIILHEVNHLIEDGKVPAMPVFLDSPLAIKMTDVYVRHKDHFNKHVNADYSSGDDIFDFPGLKLTRRVDDSKAIFSAPNPKLIIAGSGMSNGGRVIHHEMHYLSDPKTTIIFAGYQAPKSLGREISDGAKKVRIFGKEVKVRAAVENITGFSGHADRDGILSYVEQSGDSLKKVFVAMGELKSSFFLAQRINDYLDIKAVVPEEGETVILE